jgi:glutaredoxin
MAKVIIYTVSSCPASAKLREDWTEEGRKFEERQTDQNQRWLDEALKYGDMVPIIVYENGDVEIGYKNMIG